MVCHVQEELVEQLVVLEHTGELGHGMTVLGTSTSIGTISPRERRLAIVWRNHANASPFVASFAVQSGHPRMLAV